MVIILGTLAILFAVSTGYLLWQNQELREIEPATNAIPSPQSAIMPTQQSTQGEIVNWKEYTSDRDGFSFKYPLNWYMRDFSDAQLIRIDDKPLTDIEMGEGPFYSGFIEIVSVEEFPSSQAVGVSDPVGMKKCEGNAYCVTKVSEFSVGGKRAYKMLITTAQPEKSYWYEIDLGNNKVLKLTNGSQEPDKLFVLDKVLSTIKFAN